MWLNDLRRSVVIVVSRPGSTMAVAGMLGLSIALTTTVFALLDATVLRPVPFRSAEELVFVHMGTQRGGRTSVAPSVLQAWRESQAFAGTESAELDGAPVDLDGVLISQKLAWVTSGLFPLLGGASPLLGRVFDASTPADAVMLSETVWRQMYGADPDLIGRRVIINGSSLVVQGILPSTFRFPSWDTGVWRPINFDALPSGRADARPVVYARLSTDMPKTDAQRIATEAARSADPDSAQLIARIRPLTEIVTDRYYQRALPLLSVGVALVFVVLCLNVTGLLLTRLVDQRRELSIRAAFGATRSHLMRHVLLESAITTAFGIGVGLLTTWALMVVTKASLSDALLLRTLNELDIDRRVLVVASMSAALVVMTATFLPAWLGTQVDGGLMLRSSASGTSSSGGRSFIRGLIAVEIAFASALLICSMLLVRSFVSLAHTERGITSTGLIVATMSMPESLFPDDISRMLAARALEEELRQDPSIQATAWSYGVPPNGGAFSHGEWRSDALVSPVIMTVDRYGVGSDFLALYGIPLLRGRGLRADDSRRNVVVSERLADLLWPNLDPVGRTFDFGDEQFEVVGLAGEIRYPTVDAPLDRPEFYEPLSTVGRLAMLNIRCRHICPDVGQIRRRIISTHSAIRVDDVRSVDEIYREQLSKPRAAAVLSTTFTVISIVAAAGGLFAILSRAVARRRQEFGIRTALGASPGQIRGMVLQEGLLLAFVGMSTGTVAAWFLARSLASIQFGITINTPISWLASLGLLTIVVALACWYPARQATRFDPARLLRQD